jgi:hypothetical protein
LKDFLALFRITQSHNDEGKTFWSIEVHTNGTESPPRSAYFDQEHTKWVLDRPANEHPSNAQLPSKPAASNNGTIKLSKNTDATFLNLPDYFNVSNDQNWLTKTPNKQQQQNAQAMTDVEIQKKQYTPVLYTANWTSALPPSDHVDFFRNRDWAASPLGHFSKWPQSLRLYTHMMFSDSRAAAIYWGPKRIALYRYNDVSSTT